MNRRLTLSEYVRPQLLWSILWFVQFLVISFACASTTQNAAVLAHFFSEADAFATLVADHVFAFISRHLFRGQLYTNPAKLEKILVFHFVIGTHLLLVPVTCIRKHLLSEFL